VEALIEPNDSPLSVTHIVAPGPFGGAESVVLGLAAPSDSARYTARVIAITLGPGSTPFVEQAVDRGIPVETVQGGRRRYLAEARAIEAHLRRTRPSVVHAHVYYADIVAYPAARRCGLPIVSTMHGNTGGDLRNRFYEWCDRKLLARFNAVICVAPQGREALIRAGCRPERLFLVPNGLSPSPLLTRSEARARLGLAPSDRVIAWVGRLSPEKGPDLLIAAVARMQETNAIVVLLGEGPEASRIVSAATANGLSQGSLRLLGRLPDAASLLPAFDALAISSRTEGLPMVLLEAMAARLPVVAFGVGAVGDVVDQASAWVVPPGDVAAFAAALDQALSDPAEARRRATAAAEILQSRYSSRAWRAKVEAVYDLVCGSGANPPGAAPR